MIKIIKNLYILFAAMLFLFASCSTTKMSYYESIPDDAVAHISMNFEKMAKKINGKEVLASFIYKQFIREIQEDNSKAAAFVDDFFKNPENSGIDFSTDAGFFYMKTPDNNTLLFCLNIKDYGKFDDFINKLFKLAEVDKIIKDDGFQYISEDETFFCWNESYVIHFIPEEVSNPDLSLSYIRNIMKGEVENPITKNKDFIEFCDNKKDVNGWISDKIIDDEETRKSAEEMFGATLDNSFIHAFLSFNKDDMTLTAELKANEEMKKANVFKELMKTGIDKKVLTHLPGPELAAVLSYAFNPDAIYNKFLKDDEDTQEIDATFSAMANMTLQDVVNSFGGDMVILVSGFQKPSGKASMIGLEIIEGYEPRITIAISLNNKDFFETILKAAPPEFVKESGDFYEVNIDGLIVHTGVIDGVWLITNDTEVVGNGGKVFAKSLAQNEISDAMGNSSSLFHLDISEKSVKEFMQEVTEGKEDWKTVMKYFKSLSLYISNDFNMTIKLGVNPVNDNSLESLFEIFNVHMEEEEKIESDKNSPMN